MSGKTKNTGYNLTSAEVLTLVDLLMAATSGHN